MTSEDSESRLNRPPEYINEFAVVGEFGYNRFEGPFHAEKDGTMRVIDIPADYEHPSLSILSHHEGDSVALVIDGEVQGGGVIEDIIDDLEDTQYRVLVDEYAKCDPYA